MVNPAREATTTGFCCVNTFFTQGPLAATPDSLAPHDPHDPIKARRVDQGHIAAAMAIRDHPALRATHRQSG
jgi:hypothetical protein